MKSHKLGDDGDDDDDDDHDDDDGDDDDDDATGWGTGHQPKLSPRVRPAIYELAILLLLPGGGGEATANKVRRKSLTRRGAGRSEGLGKISELFPNNYSH